VNKKFESVKQPGLFYWAEFDDFTECWIVVSQASGGYPVTEACDDWFSEFEDAATRAQELAEEK